jgi:hypothetical protein
MEVNLRTPRAPRTPRMSRMARVLDMDGAVAEAETPHASPLAGAPRLIRGATLAPTPLSRETIETHGVVSRDAIRCKRADRKARPLAHC